MRLFKLVTCASLLVFLTTGCSISSKSPEELIEEKPTYNENKEILEKNINQEIPQTSLLVLPSNSNEVGKINEVDLNNDGVNELVAFVKKENLNVKKENLNVKKEKLNEHKKNEVGFMVFKQDKNKSYKGSGSELIPGDSIKYANFYDLDGDGCKEIVLLIKEDNKTNMHIYSFKDNKIKEIYKLNPTWIKDNHNLLDMKVKIGHIDDDDKLDILMIHYNSKNSKAYVSLANFSDKLELIDSTEFNNVKNLNNLYITIDTISAHKVDGVDIEKKGIILDIQITQDSNYITQILYLKDNKLKRAFNDDDKNIMKPYYIPIEDMNEDKSIEIPIITGKGSGNMYSNKNSANVSWYKWNGKEDEKSGLVFVSEIYYNYKYNYKFEIPNNLRNELEVEQTPEGNDILFKFYYYDKVKFARKDLFTIALVNKKFMDDKKNSANLNGILLNETSEYSFILYQNDLVELEKLKLNTETLKEYFLLIY